MTNEVVRKIHIYAGVLTCGHLLIYGIAGLVATFQTSPERPQPPGATRYVPFSAPASATDKEVAERVFKELNLPLTRPVPTWSLKRTPQNHLQMDLYNINGIYRVVVLEKQGRVRVENIRNNPWLFLVDIHASTLGDTDAPRLVQIWAMWNEVGIWSLLGFCISGIWLWLTSRPRFVWGWIAVGGGIVTFVALWSAFR